MNVKVKCEDDFTVTMLSDYGVFDGMTGKILAVNTMDENFFLVDFGEDFENGHSGNGFEDVEVEATTCYWMCGDDLEEEPKKRYFSREKFIQHEGHSEYGLCRNWVDECDGKEVIDGRVIGTYFLSGEEWEIEEDEVVETKKEITLMEKIFEVFPDLEVDDDGLPNFCPSKLGYEDSCGFGDGDCTKCWDRPYKK